MKFSLVLCLLPAVILAQDKVFTLGTRLSIRKLIKIFSSRFHGKRKLVANRRVRPMKTSRCCSRLWLRKHGLPSVTIVAWCRRLDIPTGSASTRRDFWAPLSIFPVRIAKLCSVLRTDVKARRTKITASLLPILRSASSRADGTNQGRSVFDIVRSSKCVIVMLEYLLLL